MVQGVERPEDQDKTLQADHQRHAGADPQTLNHTIGKIVSKSQPDWDECVQPVMAAYRALEHVVTGFPTNFLMLGREVRALIDVVLGRPVQKADRWDSPNEFMVEEQERYRRAYEIAREANKSSLSEDRTSTIGGSCDENIRWVPRYDIITHGDMWAVRPSGPQPILGLCWWLRWCRTPM